MTKTPNHDTTCRGPRKHLTPVRLVVQVRTPMQETHQQYDGEVLVSDATPLSLLQNNLWRRTAVAHLNKVHE